MIVPVAVAARGQFSQRRGDHPAGLGDGPLGGPRGDKRGTGGQNIGHNHIGGDVRTVVRHENRVSPILANEYSLRGGDLGHR